MQPQAEPADDRDAAPFESGDVVAVAADPWGFDDDVAGLESGEAAVRGGGDPSYVVAACRGVVIDEDGGFDVRCASLPMVLRPSTPSPQTPTR